MFFKRRANSTPSKPCVFEPVESRLLMAATRLRINSGGDALVDSLGRSWQADRGFEGGAAINAAYNVNNTSNDSLYASVREGTFGYSFLVENGDYKLKLHFADPVNTTAGARKFSASAEHKEILTDFDVAAAGGGKAAIIKTINVSVRDRHLSLWFQGPAENAIVSAIEMIPATPVTNSNGITWSELAPAPIPKFEALSAVVNSKLYVLSGYYNDKAQASRRCDRFDPATNSWKRLADIPEAISHAGVAADGDTIWVVGGFLGDHPGPGTNHVWKYNTATNVWSQGPSLPAARGSGAAAILGRTLHFFGGTSADRAGDKGDHWTLNLDGATVWKTAAAFPNPVSHAAAVALDGRIFAIGGERHLRESDSNVGEVYSYNPDNNRWIRVASLPHGRSHFSSSAFVVNNRIVIMGGSLNGSANGTPTADVSEYDPVANVWRTLTPMPMALKTPVAGLIRGKIYLSTGNADTFAKPVANTWVGVLP
jgi:N-acetylneuraminic acid mutarotase